MSVSAMQPAVIQPGASQAPAQQQLPCNKISSTVESISHVHSPAGRREVLAPPHILQPGLAALTGTAGTGQGSAYLEIKPEGMGALISIYARVCQ